MTILRASQKEQAYLNGQFLLAMPGMGDERFARSVVYICAHSDEGAMGFIINQRQSLDFPEILREVGVIADEDHEIVMRAVPRHDMIVRNGGPVDAKRGFVIHTDDFMVESTMPVTDDVCLTSTVDILRAIHRGHGPSRAIMTLGYAGWGAGQLENEVAGNGWLTCPASLDMLFDSDLAGKYTRLMSHIGVDIARLSSSAGHA